MAVDREADAELVPVIEVVAARKTYGDVIALDDVDLHIEHGQVVAVLGPNGAGKTTLFELLLGLIRPTSGTVTVFGRRPGGAVLGRIGAMLQNAGVPELVTVRELVRLIGRSYPAALPVDDVLHRTGLGPRATSIVTELSGDERQRVQLATALIGAPDLLLLDEPTAGMDVAARHAFWRHARSSAAHGATIVFATHDIIEAEAVADRVVVLVDGRVIADATPDELTEHGDRALEEVFLTLTAEAATAVAGEPQR